MGLTMLIGFEERRHGLRKAAHCRFVERDEYCRLLVSFTKFVRSDEIAVGVRGLLDPRTHFRLLIEEEKLFVD
jgi:hypothetical protein